MKRFLPLLLALLLCLTTVSCEKKVKSPSSDPPKESSPSSASPDAAGPEPESNAPAALSDADKARLEALIDAYKHPPQDIPAASEAKPSGINFYYNYEDGSRIRAHMPEDYGPEIGQRYSFFVSLEVTVAALGPSDKTDGLVLLVSHDKGQTWETVRPPVEDIEKYLYYYIAFQDENSGLLILSDEETAVTYSTVDGGREWGLAGSFAVPEIFYELHTANDQYFLIGRNDGCPIVSQSADGVYWEESVLPMDREKYAKGDTVYASFDGEIGLAVATVWTNDDPVDFEIHRLYFASTDHGVSWTLYDDIFIA